MRESDPRTVLVVGGSGYFGRLLVEDLLRRTPHRVILTARTIGSAEQGRARVESECGAHAARIEVAACSLEHANTVNSLVQRCDAAVCAAGPFQRLPLSLLDACLAHGCPYLDLCDDRGYARRVCARLAEHDERSQPPVATAWSAVSALTGALARIAAPRWRRLDRARSFLATGNRQPRQRGTVESLLHSLGRPFAVACEGGEREERGWTRPRDFAFPPPVGVRRCRLVDSTDHDFLPRWLGTPSAEFRVGAELGALNTAAAAVAWLRARRLISDPARFTTLCRAAMTMLGRFGSEAGAVGVEVLGLDGQGRPGRATASIVAHRDAPMMAVMPVTIMTQRWLGESAAKRPTGLQRHDDWIDAQTLDAECRARGFHLHIDADAPETSRP
ncbi:MAG: saccharopine dehydrogenase NADP-binding domain-containing protein [Phycisphaerales bacterium]|nr:saccharopine dehydrogenase NADP-binding domain-containing protein [Phycisphaerales bacterium]